MEYFGVTQTPAPRSIRNKKLRLSFVSKKTWEQSAIVQKKTRAGYLHVSSPEFTALDLIIYADRFGLNHVTTVLQELVEEMKPSALKKIVGSIAEVPVVQRLGYILDQILNEKKLADVLYKILCSKNITPILLSTKKKKHGQLDEKWKVIINTEIEPDL
jgi:predicted transcriptional regulator of viral defense system